MTQLIEWAAESIAKDRSKELDDLYAARQAGSLGADDAIHEHQRTDYIGQLKEIVSESKSMEFDDLFHTPAMKRYLRNYSMGPIQIQGRFGPSIPRHAYRRVHIEAACLHSPSANVFSEPGSITGWAATWMRLASTLFPSNLGIWKPSLRSSMHSQCPTQDRKRFIPNAAASAVDRVLQTLRKTNTCVAARVQALP